LLKKKNHIPPGKITYSDLTVPAKPLYSHRFRITGKPDFLLQQHNEIIPIERKSGSWDVPQQGHMMQIAAYCHLVEEEFGTFVPYGILVYDNTRYTIPFDPQLRFTLESVIKKMRSSLTQKVVIRNHQDPQRCRFCSMKQYCTEKLN
jgi:CRISPR-associated exonuclease Cas4